MVPIQAVRIKKHMDGAREEVFLCSVIFLQEDITMSKTKEIQKQMMEALKAKDSARKDEDAIIKKEIKQTRETMDSAPADRDDIRSECQFKLEVYQAFAPEEMGEDQIRALVQSVLDQLQITAPTPRDKGPVMKHLMPQVKGKADGKLVNQIVGEMLKG